MFSQSFTYLPGSAGSELLFSVGLTTSLDVYLKQTATVIYVLSNFYLNLFALHSQHFQRTVLCLLEQKSSAWCSSCFPRVTELPRRRAGLRPSSGPTSLRMNRPLLNTARPRLRAAPAAAALVATGGPLGAGEGAPAGARHGALPMGPPRWGGRRPYPPAGGGRSGSRAAAAGAAGSGGAGGHYKSRGAARGARRVP